MINRWWWLVGACVLAAPALARPTLDSVMGGGGVADFALEGYRARTARGGAWDLTLTAFAVAPLEFEMGYVGSAQAVEDPSGRNPTLLSTSVYAAARVNLLPWRAQPYLLAGAGYIEYHTSGLAEAPVAGQDFVADAIGLVLPFGGGLGVRLPGHVMFDTRMLYRFVPRAGLSAPPSGNAHARPDDWLLTLRAGYAF
jgi:hypothetical protein